MRFFKGWGNVVVKLRFAVVAFWVAAAAVLMIVAPKLSDVTKTDSASFFADDSEVVRAGNFYKNLFPAESGSASYIIVIADDEGLTDADREYARQLEAFLTANSGKYLVKSVRSPFTDKDLESVMLSEDGKAAVMQVNLTSPAWMDSTNEAVRTVKTGMSDTAAGAPARPDALAVHITGDAVLGQEQVDDVKHSLDLTTKITLALIVVILLIIYRSPLAPVLPLATIGLSFLISRSVVALLTTLGYKVSSFTETFLIAVLFGAGTDYCLLLISRFREELARGLSSREALAAAFPRTAGAILSSAGTVIIGFLGMVLAKFGLFSSTGPSVAIGVGVTMLAVLTLTPALIAIFGEAIFWPAHPSRNREKESRGSPFWNKLSLAVTKRPLVFLLVALIVFAPFMMLSLHVQRSFDHMEELSAGSETVAGFNLLKAHFNQGEVLPVRVTLKAQGDLWNNSSLQAVDNVAASILKVDGVARVRTATRPAGDPIDDLSLTSQIEALTSGLSGAGAGFDELSDGLGTVKDGVGQASSGVKQGAGGVGDLSHGTAKASSGLAGIGKGLGDLSGGQQKAIGGITQVRSGMTALNTGLTQTRTGLDGMLAALTGAKGSMEAMVAANPALMMDPNFQTAYGTVSGVIGNIPAMSSGVTKLKSGVTQSQQGLLQAITGLKTIQSGMNKSRTAITDVQKGLGQIKSGQDEAAKKLNDAADSLLLIADGLQKSIDGVAQMKAELNDAGEAAKKWSAGLKDVNGVFYLPEGALDEHPDLKKAMQTYISEDGRGVVFDVVLSLQPYEAKALDSIAEIQRAVSFSLKDSALSGAEFHVTGSTSVMSELRGVTATDFIIVMVFVLLGIFVVLAILLRSLIAPLYLILTILVSYWTTLGITWLVFHGALGLTGLNWSAPFFSFVLLVALGVDYNIFLMSRVKEEYRPGGMRDGTARALASTGKIITSCGVIMAGTFGALVLSPVNELVEIGFAAVVGLLLDTFIVRCMIVPALAVKFGELNWWPGRKVRVVSAEPQDDTAFVQRPGAAKEV